MLAAGSAEDRRPGTESREGAAPTSPNAGPATQKRRVSGSRRQPPPAPLQQPAPADLAEDANAAEAAPRRSRADKRNRRCAVIENTIIAAEDDSPPGDALEAADYEAARLGDGGSVVVASHVDRLVAAPDADADSDADTAVAARRRSSLTSSESGDAGGGQGAASVLYALADGFYEAPADEEGDERGDDGEEERESNVLYPASFLAPPPVAGIDAGAGDTQYGECQEPETSLGVDLAIANETNEASLPKLRKMVRRKSSLRITADLDPGGEDEPAALRPALPPEAGAAPPPASPTTPVAGSEGTWVSSPDETQPRASAGDASPPPASTRIGAEAAPFPASISASLLTLNNELPPQQRLAVIFEGPDTAADDENIAMGDEEASGAAVALKRRLSLRFSAMSEYNPEMDFNNKALRQGDSGQAGGRPLRRGSGSRFRVRNESLKRLARSRGESSTVSPTSKEGDGEGPLSSEERRAPREFAAEPAESRESGFSEANWGVHEHRRTRSYSGEQAGKASAKLDEPGRAGVPLRSGGTLTETMIGPDGRLIVLSPSGPPLARRASDSGGLASNIGTTNRTVPLQDGPRTLRTAEGQPDERREDVGEKDEPRRSPADGVNSRAVPETMPEEGSPLPSAGESALPAEPSPAADREIDPLKDPEATGKSQRTHQDAAEPAAPRPQLAPKPKRSSPWSWLFGDGDSGSQRKQATAGPGQSPTKSSSSPPAAPDSLAGDAKVPNGSQPPPAEAEPAGATAAAATLAKEKQHRTKASAALSALFSSRGSKSSSSSSSSPAKSSAQTSPRPPEAPQAAPAAATDSLPKAQSDGGPPAAPSSRRYPPHVERAIYRLSHAKLANPRRPLIHQVLVSNMMLWYLALVARRQQQQLLAEQHQHLQQQEMFLQHQQQQQQQRFFDDDSCSDSDSDEEERERERRRRKAQKKAEKELARKAEKSAKKKRKDARG